MAVLRQFKPMLCGLIRDAEERGALGNGYLGSVAPAQGNDAGLKA
jgi:hypothetical protein